MLLYAPHAHAEAVSFQCIKSPCRFVEKPGIRRRVPYILADDLYPERRLFAELYNLLDKKARREIEDLFDGKMSSFFQSFYKGIPTASPIPPISSYLLVKILEYIGGGNISLYVDIGFSPFYFLVYDTMREAVAVGSHKNISLYLVSGYGIKDSCKEWVSRKRRYKDGIRLYRQYLKYFVTSDVWKKYLVSVYGNASDVADAGEWLAEHGFLARESLRDKILIDMAIEDLKDDIDELVDGFLKSSVAEKYVLYDTVSWLYSYIDKKKSDFYKKLALISYRNAGEYVVALGRGMEIKEGHPLETTNVLDMEIIKLANTTDYYPREVKDNFRIYHMKKPFNVFHTYLWSIRNLKPIDHLLPIAYAQMQERHLPADKLYLYTTLLKGRYLHHYGSALSRDVLLKMRSEILSIIEESHHIQKDIVVQAGITAGTSFASEYPDASIAIMRKMVYWARNYNLPALEASALNNMATAIMRMDTSQAMVRGLYEEAIMVMLGTGGGSLLLPIILNNYTIHMIGSRPHRVVQSINDLTGKLFPHRRFFTQVIKLFISMLKEQDVREEIKQLIDSVKDTDVANKRRFADFMFHQMAYITRCRQWIETVASVSEQSAVHLLLDAMDGKKPDSQRLESLSQLVQSRVMFEYMVATGDIDKAVLYGERLSALHLRYGNLLFHGIVSQWLGDLYSEMGNVERATASYMRAVYVFHELGYEKKRSHVLEKLQLDKHKWTGPLRDRVHRVLAYTLRKELSIDLIRSLMAHMDIEALFEALLWQLANFIPFWQGYALIEKDSDVEYFYSMDISGRRDIPVDEFMPCRGVLGKVVTDNGCMTGVYPVDGDRVLKVHLETTFANKVFNTQEKALFEDVLFNLSSIVSSVIVKERGIIDGLTGAYTRWYLLRRLEEIIHEHKRSDKHMALLFIDVDNFKVVNDVYGHRVGDMVLKKIVQAIKRSVRKTDVVGRYGGDEFIVVMPDTDATGALSVSRRIIDNVGDILKDIPEAQGVSVSIGVVGTEMLVDVEVSKLVEYADKAMYISKQRGKAQVSMWSGDKSWS